MLCFIKRKLLRLLLLFRGKRNWPVEFLVPRAPRMSDGTEVFSDNQKVDEQSTVFVGDSITYAANFSRAFPAIRTANQGIPGDSSKGVLARIPFIAQLKPRAIFLRIGINDLQGNLIPCEYGPVYKDIVATIQAISPGTKIYCMSICPIGKPFENFHYNIKNRILEYNKFIAGLCKVYGVTYVDDHYLLTDPEGWLREKNYADALHLSPEGYTIVFRNLRKYLY